MGRLPRPVGANTTYHLMSRGNRGGAIFQRDADRLAFLQLLGRVCVRHEWECLAYCLMNNHFHLAVTTPEPDVPAGMAELVGQYARTYNRTHGLIDHLFGRRYTAVVIESDAQLLTVMRYIARNPVRAGLVERAELWEWSSYAATLGLTPQPAFLRSEAAIGRIDSDPDRGRATLRSLVDDSWMADAPGRVADRAH